MWEENPEFIQARSELHKEKLEKLRAILAEELEENLSPVATQPLLARHNKVRLG